MKTHELAYHLELLAKFLRQLPDTELDAKCGIDLQPLLAISDYDKKERSSSKSRALPTGIEHQLAAMSPAEIEAFLLSEEKAFTSRNLTELAERLGLTTSKRQNKSALVNMITRHYEATRMHAILRNARSDEA